MSSISSSMMDPAFAASQFQQQAKPNDMRAAAEQFEALFLQQMMAQARKSKLSEDILSNKGTETYNNLLDQERATELAKTLDLISSATAILIDGRKALIQKLPWRVAMVRRFFGILRNSQKFPELLRNS